MRIVFCVYGFSEESQRLQPWLTIYHVALGLLEEGWDVHVLTDVESSNSLGNISVHFVESLRSTNKYEVRRKLETLNPDFCVVLTTPLNLAASGWYKYYTGRLVAFLSYPFYTNTELLRALPHLKLEDVKTYCRHMVIPDAIWGGNLRRYFKSVVAQSSLTANRVADIAGGIERHFIPAGIDLDEWNPDRGGLAERTGHTRYVYLGWTKAIRGFDVLVRSYRKIAGPKTELRVLARGASDDELRLVHNRLEQEGLGGKVKLVGGWMSSEDLRTEISQASVVVLPFILVPSELPVSVMECIACGTPVIGTDIDGLPDAIGDAGMIVRSGSVAALTEAMSLVHRDNELLAGMQKACGESRGKMLSWNQVASKWMHVFED